MKQPGGTMTVPGDDPKISNSFLLVILRCNEQIIGVRAFLTKQPGGTMTVTGDDPKIS